MSWEEEEEEEERNDFREEEGPELWTPSKAKKEARYQKLPTA